MASIICGHCFGMRQRTCQYCLAKAVSPVFLMKNAAGKKVAVPSVRKKFLKELWDKAHKFSSVTLGTIALDTEAISLFGDWGSSRREYLHRLWLLAKKANADTIGNEKLDTEIIAVFGTWK